MGRLGPLFGTAGLRLALSVVALAAATPATADPMDRWQSLIEEASLRFGVPSAWIARVMREESAGLTSWNGRPIRSSKGAIGLMQLMPATWSAMRARLNLGENPDDPRDNIVAGTFYLRLMYERFGYPGLFAAYSCGPARYADYVAGARPLPSETIAYLGKLGIASSSPATTSQMARAEAPHALSPSLFVVRHDVQDGVVSAAPQPVWSALFAVRRPVP